MFSTPEGHPVGRFQLSLSLPFEKCGVGAVIPEALGHRFNTRREKGAEEGVGERSTCSVQGGCLGSSHLGCPVTLFLSILLPFSNTFQKLFCASGY